ncbi:MAG: UvrD-helicase domain-containing protein, partial [Thermoanaerobaculia bacterium]
MTAMQQSFTFTPTGEAPKRQNLVIEAGAGTGKTTTIAGEVIRLMLEDPALAPERIVLMTFTEKAAGEIADRIRAGLEHLHASIDDERPVWPPKSASPIVAIDDSCRERARLALSRHLPRIDALRSQTIHSFCQSLLRSFPIEAGLDPQFKIVEGFERSLLYSQLYDQWVDLETRTSPTDSVVREWELLFAHSGYLFLVRELIFALVDRRDLLQEGGYGFGDVLEIEEGMRDVVSAVRRSEESAGDENAQRVLAFLRANDPP